MIRTCLVILLLSSTSSFYGQGLIRPGFDSSTFVLESKKILVTDGKGHKQVFKGDFKAWVKVDQQYQLGKIIKIKIKVSAGEYLTMYYPIVTEYSFIKNSETELMQFSVIEGGKLATVVFQYFPNERKPHAVIIGFTKDDIFESKDVGLRSIVLSDFD